MAPKPITVALAGNPNAGKSTIFNNLTGTRQKVGNWPGVTVERKEGHLTAHGHELTIVDLPGTYSLTAYSIEEIVARDFILDEKPDVVVDIIDASNLERNLYLATQVRELDTKVIYVLNMADVARQRGVKIDSEKLTELLDVPVVFTVGNRNEGTEELLEAIISVAEADIELPRTRRVYYGKDIEKALAELSEFIEEKMDGKLPYNTRWIAIKLLEKDKIVQERILQAASPEGEAVLCEAEDKRERLREFFDEEPEIVMTDHRYGFIAGIVKEVLKTVSGRRVDVSRQVDQVLTNRLLGLPIFVFFIWAMFQLTFSLGAYPMDWIDAGVGWLGSAIGGLMPGGLFRDMMVDGVIAGVGSVVIFLPNILILFFCIALFEDTGYMARAAFLMVKGLLIHMWDRSKIFLRKMGGVILIGSVVVWVLSAFPRDVQFSRDYETEIAQTKAHYGASVSPAQDDLGEKLVRERDKAIATLEAQMAKEKVEKSYMGHMGKALAPVFAPIGMDWRGSVAVISGFVAKEIVVSTMGVLYAAGADGTEKNEALKLALKRSGMTALSAYAMMAFVLIYIPCLATVAVIRRETNSWKWAFFSIAYSTLLAWLVAFLIYQGGRLIGLG